MLALAATAALDERAGHKHGQTTTAVGRGRLGGKRGFGVADGAPAEARLRVIWWGIARFVSSIQRRPRHCARSVCCRGLLGFRSYRQGAPCQVARERVGRECVTRHARCIVRRILHCTRYDMVFVSGVVGSCDANVAHMQSSRARAMLISGIVVWCVPVCLAVLDDLPIQAQTM